MKKLIIPFLFLVTLSAFTSEMAFWAAPVPGINIIVKRNPGGIVFNSQTDNDGKFSVTLKKGKYDLIMTYDSILVKIGRIENKPTPKDGDYEITLSLDPDTLPGVTINGKTPTAKLIITRKTGAIAINVTGGDTAITGIIGFAIRENGTRMN